MNKTEAEVRIEILRDYILKEDYLNRETMLIILGHKEDEHESGDF